MSISSSTFVFSAKNAETQERVAHIKKRLLQQHAAQINTVVEQAKNFNAQVQNVLSRIHNQALCDAAQR